jgi:hypothetical protein
MAARTRCEGHHGRGRDPRGRRPLVSVYDLRPEAVSYQGFAKALQMVWIAARSSLRDVFEHVTIRDLAIGELPQEVTNRTRDEEAWRAH